MKNQYVEISKKIIETKEKDVKNKLDPNNRWYYNDIITKFCILPAVLLTGIFIISDQYPNALFLDGIWHFNFEIFAVVFDSLIAVYCLSRYKNSNEEFFLFLGIGFIASALIDFLHALVSLSFISEISFLTYFIPQTWAAGRLIDAIMIIIVFLKYDPSKIFQSSKFEKSKKQIFSASAIVTSLVIGSISFSLLTPVPNIIVNGIIHRPYDAIAALIFIFSLIMFFQKKFYKQKDIFVKGLAGFIVISIFVEITISSSANNFDTEFNVAHILKNFSYLLIIIVLSQSLNTQTKLKQHLLTEIKNTQQQKEEFLTMISHELKTPLSPIMMWADALIEPGMLGDLNKEQKDAVKRIILSTKDLEKLVNDVFDTYKLELGQIKFFRERINSKNLIDEIIKNSYLLAAEKNIRITDISATNVTFFSDDTRIIQILRNLVNNSIKFIPKDSGLVEINCFEKEYFIHFTVKDNGIGINENHVNSLFKKFYQIDSSQTKEHGGTGLGLSICEGLVHGLGGEIWVNSKEGKGSTFCFTIKKNLD